MVSPEDCNQMREFRQLQNRKLSPVDEVTLASDLDAEEWPSRTFSSDVCQDACRFVLQKGSISTFEGTVITSLMLNVDFCKFEEGICSNDGATVVWNPPKMEECRHSHVGSFTAQFTNNMALIPNSQAAFELQKEVPEKIRKCFSEQVQVSSSKVIFVPKVQRRRKRSSPTANNLLEEFLQLRIHTPNLHLRQANRIRSFLPSMISYWNVSEYVLERQMRMHPMKDISLAILYTLVEKEASEAKLQGKPFSQIAYPDGSMDYSPTEAESWISLAKILLRKISTPMTLLPTNKPLEQLEPVKSYIGTSAHVKYLQTSYDRREDQRRNLTSSSVNARIQFNNKMLQSDLQKNFEELSRTLCKVQARQAAIWKALIQIEPTIGMRAILQRNDIFASYVGPQVLFVTQCSPIKAKEIIQSRRIGDACFLQTPIVTSKNKTMFIVTGTSDVTSSSKRIPCEEVTSSVFEAENGTFTKDGKVQDVQQPNALLHSNISLSSIKFLSGDIFETSVHSAFPMALAVSFGESLQSMQLQKKSFLKPTTLEKYVNEKKKTLQELARLGGYAWDTATDTIKDTIDEVKGFYKEYAIFVGSILCVIVLAARFVYLIIVMYCRDPFGIFNVKLEEEVNYVDQESDSPEPETYQEAVKPFLAKYPPLMTYVPILISLVNTVQSTTLPFVPITIRDRITVGYTRSKKSATAANGSSFTFLGHCFLPVRIGNTTLETKFLISDDQNCPAAVLLGYDFMSQLEEKGISTTLLPGQKKMIVGSAIVPLLRQGERIYRHTDRKVEVMATNNIHLMPGKTKSLRITFNTTEPVHLQPPPSSQIQYQECLIDPWLEGEAVLKITNAGTRVCQISSGEVLGEARIIQSPSEQPRSREPAESEMTSPEADWTERLPQSPSSSEEFLNELNMDRSVFSSVNRKKLRQLVIQYKEAFCNEDKKMGLFRGPIQHEIVLIKSLPNSRRIRIPYRKREEINHQVEKFLKDGIVEPSHATFTSPVILVKKKDATLRFTVDFRTLNSCTRKENYVIPCVSEILDLASGSFIYSAMDFISGFFQIKLKKEHRPLTAFETDRGTFQFRTMPMGVSGAPHTFQEVARYLQSITKARRYAYLDDLLLVSQSEEEHLKDIEELLRNTIDVGLKLKLKKCMFGCKELEFLGYIIGADGLKPNPDKVASIQDFPVPKTQTAVRSFHGMVGYFRRFILNFAGIAIPLYKLTEKDQEFEWTPQCQESFDFLKKTLLNPPVLVGPDLNKDYILETDASLMAIASILLQKNDQGIPNAIAYASRKLSSAERNYAPIEAEALAIVFGLKYFRQYLLGAHTVVITDHKPLCSLMRRKDLDGRLQKYQLSIQDYDAKIVYRPGKENVLADALSRYCKDEVNEPKTVAALQTKEANAGITLEELQAIQAETPWMSTAISAIQNQEEGRKAKAWQERFLYQDGVLRKKTKTNEPSPIVIPRHHEIRERIINHFHRSPFHAAHLGIDKTLAIIKRMFYWTNMRNDITATLNECLECARRKTDRHQTTREPMGTSQKFTQPAQHWHLDHIGPLPITEDGNRYILCCKDPFSRYVETAAVASQDGATTTDQFLKIIVAKHGVPASITTDNGTGFLNEKFKTAMKELQIEHLTCAPYHHQSNGHVERTNRTLEEILSSYVNKTQDDWDQFLHLATFAINASPSATTKFSPFEAMFGRKPELAESNALRNRCFEDNYQATMKTRLAEMWKSIQNTDSKETTSARRTAEKQMDAEDMMLLKRPSANKLAPRRTGPHQIKEVLDQNVLFKDRGGTRTAHKDDVRTDNGTNFTLGAKIIKKTFETTDTDLPDEVQKFLRIQGIDWKFITPLSPWKGGMYERMVKTAKQMFMKEKRLQKLTLTELQTVFNEVAAMMNDRPLTYPDNEVGTLNPIRPSDFLTLKLPVTIPWTNLHKATDDYLPLKETQSEETRIGTIRALEKSMEASESLWRRFSQEYLSELRLQHKNRMDKKRGSATIPKVGQCVLLWEEQPTPRNVWKIAEIEELITSPDGHIREAIVRTVTKKELSKSINHLIPLELDEPTDENDSTIATKPNLTKSSDDENSTKPRYNLRNRKPINYDDDKNSFEACVEDYCTNYHRINWNAWNERYDVWIPQEKKIRQHHATIKIYDGEKIKTWELDCQEVRFCETIDCTICWTNILNPECHIWWAIGGLAAAAFIGLLILHSVCFAPIRLAATFILGWKITKILGSCILATIKELWRRVSCKWTTRARQRYHRMRMIIVLWLVLMTPLVLGCQQIDVYTQFQKICSQKTIDKCETFTEVTIDLNSAHKEGCIRLEKNGTVIRDIRIRLIEIRQECTKEIVAYSKDVETRIWSSKRCPRMGSCSGDKCKGVNRTSTIPELEHANQYIGNTYCTESCGTWGCGCGWFSSGCIFYRIYAFPRSDQTVDIFRCLDYRPTARFQITSSKLNSKQNEKTTSEVQMPIGQSETWADMTLTTD
ncbi:hypothetical protein B9Z55_028250 [Caenorhabditis nigoni]|uniref:RNA-directed DNA polymerase n=2 Tax=Caenorhabditis nigoni TaxID=1611254 RepID=A0A2G5SCX8_9PELO|nr:hypothetical protein B9Z55_028250 [Caenorhabditis nigoni]